MAYFYKLRYQKIACSQSDRLGKPISRVWVAALNISHRIKFINPIIEGRSPGSKSLAGQNLGVNVLCCFFFTFFWVLDIVTPKFVGHWNIKCYLQKLPGRMDKVCRRSRNQSYKYIILITILWHPNLFFFNI